MAVMIASHNGVRDVVAIGVENTGLRTGIGEIMGETGAERVAGVGANVEAAVTEVGSRSCHGGNGEEKRSGDGELHGERVNQKL